MLFGWEYVLSSVCADLSKGVLINPSEESRRILLGLNAQKTITPAIGEYSDVAEFVTIISLQEPKFWTQIGQEIISFSSRMD
jgi:hypothetical protein